MLELTRTENITRENSEINPAPKFKHIRFDPYVKTRTTILMKLFPMLLFK